MRFQAAAALLIPSVYWLLVLANIRRVRRRTGRAPSLSPSRREEAPLRIGWHIVIAGWFLQPLWQILSAGPAPPFRPVASLDSPPFLWAGGLLGALALGLTMWSHRAMGAEWKIWVDASAPARLVERGPFRWVRHPIYASQLMALLGTWLLVPSPFLAAIVALHVFCIRTKAAVEERHLRDAIGGPYDRYRERTGRFFPRLTSGGRDR